MTKIVLWKNSHLLERGWSEEKIDYFLKKNYGNKQVWDAELIQKTEKKEKFINFAQIYDLLSRKERYQELQMLVTQEAIVRIGQREPFYTNTNSLLNVGPKVIKKNSSIEEIIHFPNSKDFSVEGKFYAYSDGCRKIVGKEEPVTCAGWIENEAGKIIVEFAKNLKKEEDKDSFEKAGIEKVIDIAIDLGIKNLNVHTDNRGDAENVGFSRVNTLEKKHKYITLLSKLDKFESFSICHIPRDYNQHADALTKILLAPYEEKKIQSILESKQEFIWDSPVVDREKHIYFEHPKLKMLEAENLFDSAKWCLYSLNHTTKTHSANMHNFLINTKTHEFHLVSQVPRESLYKDLLAQLPQSARATKNKGGDSEHIYNMAVLLNQFVDLKNIAVHLPNGGFKAVVDKIKAIPANMQEEFFLAHKAISKYENVSMGSIPPELLKSIKAYVGEENYKVYNTNNTKSAGMKI